MENVVKIPASDYFRMKKAIERIDKHSTVNDLINEEEAARLLELTKAGIQNKVYRKEMEGMYIIGLGGKRFYYKSKLVGIDNEKH